MDDTLLLYICTVDKASKRGGKRTPLISLVKATIRDGFMSASLGINYTPCQPADAYSRVHSMLLS